MLLMAGYSIAQELDPLAHESHDVFSQQEQQADPFPQHPPQPQYQPQILSPDDIPKGFSSQIKASQPKEEAPKVQQAAPVAKAPAPKKEMPPPPVAKYANYEIYLDTIDALSSVLVPSREKINDMIKAIEDEPLRPKRDNEKQEIYDKFVADREKSRKTRIANLEKQYSQQQKRPLEKLIAEIKLSDDIQPEWGETLLQNADEDSDEYQKRLNKFKSRISEMNFKIARITNVLTSLNIGQGNLNAMEKKNLLYIKRLERAIELMNNYMLQDQMKILATENIKGGVTLGEYDAEKEMFPVNVRNPDVNSKVVYDFHGFLKVSPYFAQRISELPDAFITSVDYVNYPFIIRGEKVYPGAKEMYIFYEEGEVPAKGVFKIIDGYEHMEGFPEWAMRADSLINGKIKYRKLDHTYAMKKVSVGPPFWTTKRIIFASMLTASATSLGIALWQNSSVSNKTKSADRLYEATLNTVVPNGDKTAYDAAVKAYEDKVDSRFNSQVARNLLYVSASGFAAGAVWYMFF